jgi:protein-tyrosine-phosphatase
MSLRERVLFACTYNSIRSPLAAAVLEHIGKDSISADAVGVYAEVIDPFVVAVMLEWGVDLQAYVCKSFADLPSSASFTQTIALSGQAFEEARVYPETLLGKIHYWQTEIPATLGSREQQMASYRKLRDDLALRIRKHFSL